MLYVEFLLEIFVVRIYEQIILLNILSDSPNLSIFTNMFVFPGTRYFKGFVENITKQKKLHQNSLEK
ncbi:hypothetical protein DCMF_07310 [Candidatus Formimonas warabiya]|uniref:Uncharacterized protein n=1 Tax=Formimonas warabiya TaxID=1761012 RepID=A0A3G1KQA1_FORW1|nr:hypothetical protein DCMF_07310 [Candidatus Formimonas warabiya]